MPDPKRENPTPTERPSNPDPGRKPAGGDHPGDAPIEMPPPDSSLSGDDLERRRVGPEDEDRKVRTDKGEKRPFGVMP